jgi:hypothetical protein
MAVIVSRSFPKQNPEPIPDTILEYEFDADELDKLVKQVPDFKWIQDKLNKGKSITIDPVRITFNIFNEQV